MILLLLQMCKVFINLGSLKRVEYLYQVNQHGCLFSVHTSKGVEHLYHVN